MFVSDGDSSEVKVQVSFAVQAAVPPPLTAVVQDMLSVNIEVPVLATPELYGSELVVALDRPPPRDMFGVQLMFARFGLRGDFLDCFVVYLAAHDGLRAWCAGLVNVAWVRLR
ncbi:nucleotidyl transferase AbiEii/AbiGii toxin family protein [Paraburkholderia agricolaris]